MLYCKKEDKWHWMFFFPASETQSSLTLLICETYFGTLGHAVFMNKKENLSVTEIHPSVWMRLVWPPPSVIRNTVSCGECVGELMAQVAHPQTARHVSARHFLGLLGNSAKNMVKKSSPQHWLDRKCTRACFRRVQGWHEGTDQYLNSWFNFALTTFEYYKNV